MNRALRNAECALTELRAVQQYLNARQNRLATTHLRRAQVFINAIESELRGNSRIVRSFKDLAETVDVS